MNNEDRQKEVTEKVYEILGSKGMMEALGPEPPEMVFNVAMALMQAVIVACNDKATLVKLAQAVAQNLKISCDIARDSIYKGADREGLDMEGKIVVKGSGRLQ